MDVHLATLARPAFLTHVASVVPPILMWLALRWRVSASSQLRAIETAGVVLSGGTLALMARGLPGEMLAVTAAWDWGSNPDLRTYFVDVTHEHFVVVAAFASSGLLVLRAALVPSTVRWTIAISGAVQVVVALAMAWGDDRSNLLAISSGAYGAMSIAVAAAVSHVIHGLREAVRTAQQLGQYTLDEKIGEGGMGVVYRARHAMLRRETAVKLLPPDRTAKETLARFEREVQLTARLSHPHTITIFDYGRTPDGVFYYAMEFVDGLTLEQIVELDGPQPVERVVALLRMVAGALAEAHSVGLIHRDIKPANILLGPLGGRHDVAKVVDFGLVKEVHGAGVDLSSADVVVGTPNYLPPESITAPDTVDGRSDLYSLGATGHFLLTGKPVFEGKTVVEVCTHHLHTEAPRLELGEKGAACAALLHACLAKDPADRPASAEVLEAALAEIAQTLPWTEAEANAWWTEHADVIQQSKSAAPSPSGSRTIAIDLADRQGSIS
jgi:serine/threonine-protein kinase